MTLQKFINFFLLFSTVNSLYFQMGEKEKKCFIEEVPEETMVTGKYKAQLFDPNTKEYKDSPQGMGMFVEVTDPNKEVVLRVFARNNFLLKTNFFWKNFCRIRFFD